MTPIARHRWVYIDAPHRGLVAATCADAALRDAVFEWLARDRPLIARSRQPADGTHLQALGLCLPDAKDKRRVALRAPPAAVARHDEPAPLHEVAHVLPRAARPVARALVDAARRLGFEARAFGSAAWQWRTGEAYLREGSDLDLLAAPPGATALKEWLAGLGRFDAASPMRLDGEVECPSGDCVNWRELANGGADVLLKSSSGARLAPRAEVWAQFR
jgi:phosphoribosyl-dephospho-CoA transferase